MPPITWKNVNAPSSQGASRILEAAGRSANTGVNQLTGLAREMGNINTANQNNQNAINTESVLGQIAGLNSVGQVDAAVNAGTFNPDNLVAGVDKTAVRKALANQPVIIDDRLSKEFAASNRQQLRNDAPVSRELNNLIAANNLTGAQEVLNSESAPANTAPFSTGIRKQAASNLAVSRAEEDRRLAIQRELNAPITAQINAQSDLDKEISAINEENALANLPVDKPITAKQQAITPESAIKDLRNKFSNKTWFDTASDSGGQELITRVTDGISTIEKDLGKKVPGYIMDEVNKQIEAESGGEQGAWFSWDKSANSNRYLDLVRTRMQQAGVSDANRIKRGAVKRGTAKSRLQSELERINKNRQLDPRLRP
jgi:hypothetical protein